MKVLAIAAALRNAFAKPALWLWLAAMALLVALASAWITRGDWLYAVLVFSGMFYVAAPAAFVGTVFLLIGRKLRKPLVETSGLLFLGVSLFVFLQLSGFCFGLQLAAIEMTHAKNFCELLVPKLEAWRQVHGQYPIRVQDVLPEREGLPRLLRHPYLYEGTTSNFSFTINDPNSFSRVWIYCSETKTWVSD